MNSYVLKGTFKLQVGDEIKETPVDSMVFVPRGIAQNFMKVAPGPGEFLGRCHARRFRVEQQVFRHHQPSCPSRPPIVS